MKVNNSNQIIKLLFGIALAGTILLIGIGMSGSPVARAQEAWTDTPIQSTSPGDTPFPIQGTPEPTLLAPVTSNFGTRIQRFLFPKRPFAFRWGGHRPDDHPWAAGPTAWL